MLLLNAAMSTLFAGAAAAQDGRSAMSQFEMDVRCAAAAEAWLIGMPNGTTAQEQQETWNVLGFYVARAQASAQAVGHPAIHGFGATQAFVADVLPRLKSSDAAEAEKARAEAASGTHGCAARPEFQDRSKASKP